MASKRLLLSFFAFVFLSLTINAQQVGTISGKVKDPDGKPLFGASIGVIGKAIGVYSKDDGSFTFQVPANENLQVIISYTGLKQDTFNIRLIPGEKKEIISKMTGKIYQITEFTVYDKSLKSENATPIDPKIVKMIPTPNQSVEDILKTLPGVSSANELSSTYNVRGGNYDENLVYINDFEVYRPMLVRSGQQEGLSVINPDMVDGIKFSAGGFDAKYGDKLSSVLDIRYRRPKKFGGSVSASLLGASLELENQSKTGKFYYMLGGRQKSNQYLLNTFETEGEYKPSFTDVQILTGVDISKKLNVEVFGNYARNRYNLVPQSRETNFGTINDAKRFTVYFEGQELDKYETFTGSFSATFKPKPKLSLKLIGSYYKSHEEENFDILGQYFLDQLENDLGKDDFGNVAFNLGVGSFLNHARNTLDGEIFSLEQKGEIINESSLWQWGIKIQQETFSDKLHEWYYNDSAGFSINSYRDSMNPQIILNDVVIGKNNLTTHRINGYIQNTWQITDTTRLVLTTGIRANYSDLNEELIISPRVSVTYKPRGKKNLSLRAAGGFYYQPPFYRELRGSDGKLYPDVKAQKSIHAVIGGDMTFLALGREFKLTAEVFYKSLENLIPYKVDNLRLRYLPQFTSKGYSQGIDLRLFGDFVPGAESWLSVSYLQTEEDLRGDFYYRYFDEEGKEIFPGASNSRPVDSTKVEPGYIPRPADQRLTFGVFFQDYLPKFPTYKMQLSLIFGTALPFGPPGNNRYTDLLRTPTYRRVDIGFSKQLIGDEVKKKPQGKFMKNFESMWVGLEVFNLLQVSNVASYTWITDVTNARKYAVPNYLTGRQLNIRLTAQF
ncbi:MAG: carboxypeptidase-like regulatory domain-containing protein [Bacteroidetes bacterium]|nr:carboxypeptidase-like regulatory domain-containing protein [Bacteroidota bacterium]